MVSGVSKFIVVALPYWPRMTAPLIRYDKPLATTIITRIMKIQTSSCT